VAGHMETAVVVQHDECIWTLFLRAPQWHSVGDVRVLERQTADSGRATSRPLWCTGSSNSPGGVPREEAPLPGASMGRLS
jgi:hypothetical protein